MAQKARSPFGSMVREERRSRKWTQARLALEVAQHLPASEKRKHFTERSIVAFERMTEHAHNWVSPRSVSVEAIARAFGFAPATSSYQALIDAAATTHRLAAQPEQTITQERRTPRFIPAGREPYLAHVAERVALAVAGTPQALAVGADAGTGKTWLVVEACRRAVLQHPNLVVLWSSSSLQPGIPEPFQPFRQLLRMMVGGDRAPSSDYPISKENRLRIQSRIPAALATLDAVGRDLLHRLVPVSVLANDTVRDRPDLQPLVTSLTNHPGGQHRATPDDTLYRVIVDYAAAGPLIVVLEDLHTSDEGTIRAISSILRKMHGTTTPLLVLTSFRPEINHHGTTSRLEPLFSTLDTWYPTSMIDLAGALQPATSENFIAALASDMGLALDSNEVHQVHEQTLGLPTLVDGMLHLRHAHDHGFAQGEPSAPLSHARILDAELDLLAPTTRACLVAASVQGEVFALEVLSQVVGTSVEQLHTMLNDTPFWRRGLVQAAGESTISDRQFQEFQFTHTLMRDHLYDALSEIERAHLHQLTATALTALHGDAPSETSGQIAHHWERAGATIPAAEAWLASARYLVNWNEYDSAQFAYHKVREQQVRLSAPALEAEALLGLGVCARALDEHGEAMTWLERGLDFARRRNLPTIEARLLSQLGMLAYDAGEVDRGSELLREAIALHERTGDLADAAHSLARLSHNLHGLGHYDDAARQAKRSIDLATVLGDDSQLNGGRIALANCYLDIGRFEAAVDLYETTLAAAATLGDVHRANICLINLALCQIEQQQWDEAAAIQEPLLDRSRPIVPRFMGTVEYQFGLIAEGKGRWGLARQHFQTSLEVRTRNGQDALAIDSLAGLLRVATARQEAETARHWMQEIDDRLARRNLDGIEHVARVCLAMIEGGQLTENRATINRYTDIGLAFIERRASAMASNDDRQTYLTRVQANQQLLDLAKQVTEADEAGRLRSLASD